MPATKLTSSARYQGILGSKKVGMRPDAGEGEKRTNEIGTVIETLPDIANRTVTADALLTQRALAKYLLGRGADYLFTVKGNQPTLHDDIRLLLGDHRPARAGLHERVRSPSTAVANGAPSGSPVGSTTTSTSPASDKSSLSAAKPDPASAAARQPTVSPA